MANYDLNDNKYLKNRLQFHAASRIGIQTGQALAQATNGDGHIVTHKSVWSAPESAFVKHTNAAMKTTSDGIAATNDLVSVFKDGAHAYGEDLVTYPDEQKLPTHLAGKVWVNPEFPAVELYEAVTMTGVADSNGSGGKFEAYEILNGTSRVKNFIPPTAVSDGGLPVPGYTGRIEVYKGSKWTDLENCGDVAGAWALAEGNWEFVYMSGMVTFHPDYTPVGKNYTQVRFTGFRYIGETLDITLDGLEDKITAGVGDDLSEMQEAIDDEIAAREAADEALEAKDTTLEGLISANTTAIATLNGTAEDDGSIAKAIADAVTDAVADVEDSIAEAIEAEAAARATADTALGKRLAVIEGSDEGSVKKALADAKDYADDIKTDLQTEINDKVDKNGTDRLMTAAEGEKLAALPTNADLTSKLDLKANAADVYAKTATYSATEVDNKIAPLAVKATVDEALALKADAADVYTRAQVDGKVAAVFRYKGAATIKPDSDTIVLVKDGVDVVGVAGDVYQVGNEEYVYTTSNTWERLGTAVDLSPYSTTTEMTSAINDAVLAEKTRATGVEAELSTAIDAATAKAAANEAAIGVLNGADTLEGSVKKQIKDAVKIETDRATGVEDGLKGRLTTAENNIDALEGRMGTAEAAIGTVDSRIATAKSEAITAAGTAADEKVAAAKATIDAYTINDIAISTAPVLSADNILMTGYTSVVTEEGKTDAVTIKTTDDIKDAFRAVVGKLNTLDASSVEAAANLTDLTSRIGAVEGEVDTLTDTVEILNGADTLEGSVKKQIKDAVKIETDRAIAAEASNTGAINQEITDRQTAFSTLNNAISAEATRAKGVETELSAAVATNAEAITVLNGDSDIPNSVDAKVAEEATRAKGIENSLRTDVGAIQGALGTLTAAGSVESAIDTAKEAAITAAGNAADGKISTAISALTINGQSFKNNAAVVTGSQVALGEGFTPVTNGYLTGLTTASTVTAAIDLIDQTLTTITGGSTGEGGSIAALQSQINANAADIDAIEALLPKADFNGTTVKAEIAKKVNAVAGSNLVPDTEITKLSAYPAYSEVSSAIALKQNAEDGKGLVPTADITKLAGLNDQATTDAALADKVDKVEGSGLIEATKVAKLDALPTNAQLNELLAAKADKQPVVSAAAQNLEAGKRYIVIGEFEGILPADAADGSTIEIFVLVGGAGKTVTAPAGETILGKNLPCAIGISEEGWQLDNESYIFVKNGSNWHVL